MMAVAGARRIAGTDTAMAEAVSPLSKKINRFRESGVLCPALRSGPASSPTAGGRCEGVHCMAIDAPLRLYEATVRPDWVDYNGHMNEAFYVLVFSRTTDAFMDITGMDEAYRRRANASVYTLETHVMYLQEVSEGAAMRVETQLLGFDRKRFRLFHWLYETESGALLATGEHMLLHVDMAGPRAAPFPPAVSGLLAGIMEAHAGLPVPEQAGRAIALPAGRR